MKCYEFEWILPTLVDQFREILSNDGLAKIFKNIRMKLSESKSSFVQDNMKRLNAFIHDDNIELRILPRIWKHLRSMTCKHICPWCGVPCCGLKTCNDHYEPEQFPSLEEAKVKHTCQFHRDTTITGTHLLIGYIDENQPGRISDTLPNYGSCPERIRLKKQRLIWEPNATKVSLRLF